MLIGHTETRFRYDIKHSNPDWYGVSGISKSNWARHLRNKGISINSLRGGVYILNYYQYQECKGNFKCALEKYKGAISPEKKEMVKKFTDAYFEILSLEKKRSGEIIKPATKTTKKTTKKTTIKKQGKKNGK